jgi:predicted secreted Zn-dependent protease
MTASSLSPLRAIQHKDGYGNVIGTCFPFYKMPMVAVTYTLLSLADPDLSNPTRNRWERPLDTIRSFEAAIEGDYARRSVYRAGNFNL